MGVGNWLIPNVSLRVPSFFGPVVMATALLLASSVTPPTYDGFNIVALSDPTFKAKLGIWGVCTEYKKDNATTANPNATLTGNSTFDAIVHGEGKHRGCSASMIGWSYSLPVNSTGLAGIALPNSTLGVNEPSGSTDQFGASFVQVMSSGQSSILILHFVSGLPALVGILLLILPYKRWEKSSPNLSRLLKVGSLSLILTFMTVILAVVVCIIDLSVSKSIVNTINGIGKGQPGYGQGVHASVGSIQWYALAAAILFVPAILSTRGQG